MSDREFDNYLAFMSRMLRLSGAQREAIACELRDHLEQRLEELTEKGVCRDDAVAQALEEFGDAAGLAAEFTRIANQRQRRFIMRITIGSLMATAAVVLLFLSLIPSNHPTLAPHQASADEKGDPGKFTPRASTTPKSSDAPGHGTTGSTPGLASGTVAATPADENQAIEKALATRFDPDWTEQPLDLVLKQIRESTGVNMHIDWAQLANAGVARDQQVSLSLKNISAAKALELIFRGTGAAMHVEDGIVMVTTTEQASQHTEVRVYNCRDLVTLADQGQGSRRPTRGRTSGGMAPGGVPGAPGAANPAAPGGAPALGEGGGVAAAINDIFGAGEMPRLADGNPQSLLELIVVTVAQDTWQMTGGSGSIHVFDGLLVINHTPDVHRKVADLLRMIRVAALPEGMKAK